MFLSEIRNKNIFVIVAFLSTLLVFSAACGGGGDEEEEELPSNSHAHNQ